MLTALVDLLCPRRCAGCGAAGSSVCAECLGGLCQAAAWRRPTPSPPGLPAVSAVADHDGCVRQLLIAHKDRGRLDVTEVLGAALARAVEPVAAGRAVALVPVPSSPEASRRRGYDHAARLARAAVSRLPSGSRVVPLLRRVRRTRDQAGLGATDRAVNLHGALQVAPGRRALGGLACVVVDDVMTTGSTLAEASRALRSAGIEPAAAAVVACRKKRVPPDRGEG